MKRFMPHAYIVTTDKHMPGKADISNITHIMTDATYFLHCLKERLISDNIMTDPDVYHDANLELDALCNAPH